MKKLIPIFIIIIVLMVTASIAISLKKTKTVDWEESFNEKSNTPYGVSVLYKELPNLFEDHKVRTVYHQPDSYLYVNSEAGYGDHIAEGSYIIIGNSKYLTDASVDELLNFVSLGNTLFISDYDFSEKLKDTLQVETRFIKNDRDSISELSLKHVDLKAVTIDKNSGDFYFSDYNEQKHTVIGHSKIKYKHQNFIEIPFQEGHIYLHTEPKIFTNYNLLKDDNYTYVEGILSYLPNNHVYFDSYTKMQSNYYGDAEQESNLKWFLEQTAFKWAWYTALIFGLLFMVFNAKRRQRIIKIIKPLQNTTVDFVKTVSNLYFETQDHKNLVEKKITYFLEKVRTDYNINTSILDEAFVKRLASKSGKKAEDIQKLVKYINWLRTKNEFFEENLIQLNRHIEAFYA